MSGEQNTKWIYLVLQFIGVSAAVILAIVAIMNSFKDTTVAVPPEVFSPDGKYRAVGYGDEKDQHYKIEIRETKQFVFNTRAKYTTPNLVKAGKFSPDSKMFAAAYHYGNGSNKYTWVGIWDIEKAILVGEEEFQGHQRDLSSIFIVE